MSGYVASGPMYYNEIVADPKDVDRVYSMDVFMQVTDDGGKTFRNAGEKWKHVDNHALWIDPNDTDHLVNGNDGGVYESFDRAATWEFKANLPITQFYRVEADTVVAVLLRLRGHPGQYDARRPLAYRRPSTGSRTTTGSSRPAATGS